MVTDEQLIELGKMNLLYLTNKRFSGKHFIFGIDCAPSEAYTKLPKTEDECAIFRMLYPDLIAVLDFEAVILSAKIVPVTVYYPRLKRWS